MNTKTIFRKWKHNGEIIALFPEVLADTNICHCMSYQHIGQHGAADPCFVIQKTHPANQKEYAELKRELQGIGYKVKIIKRLQYRFLKNREKQLLKSS